ncbi:MAG: response regulator [Acidobacteria bacterium]|nr:response regulator [Acidobacteriota bacterium]
MDDDPNVRLVVDRQLDALGWEAVPVDTGQEAIRVVEGGMIVDVLLTDLHLPDIDGVAVARAVAGLSPATRVAFMSGAAPSKSLDPREAPFLLKPFSTRALANALAGAVPVDARDRTARGG